MHGQNDDLRVRTAAFDFPEAFHSIHVGHGQVQQQNIRLQLPKQPEGLFAVRRLSHDQQVRISLQQQFQTGSEQFMIIRQ